MDLPVTEAEFKKDAIERMVAKGMRKNGYDAYLNGLRGASRALGVETLTEMLDLATQDSEKYLTKLRNAQTIKGSPASQSTINGMMNSVVQVVRLYDKEMPKRVLEENIKRGKEASKQMLENRYKGVGNVDTRAFDGKVKAFLAKDPSNALEARARFIVALYSSDGAMSRPHMLEAAKWNTEGPAPWKAKFDTRTYLFTTIDSKNRKPIRAEYDFPEMRKAVDQWREYNKTVYLFPSRGGFLKEQGIRNAIKAAFKAAGVEGMGAQKLRRVGATKDANNPLLTAADLKKRAEAYGHSLEMHGAYALRATAKRSKPATAVAEKCADELRRLIEEIQRLTTVKDLNGLLTRLKSI